MTSFYLVQKEPNNLARSASERMHSCVGSGIVIRQITALSPKFKKPRFLSELFCRSREQEDWDIVHILPEFREWISEMGKRGQGANLDRMRERISKKQVLRPLAEKRGLDA